MDDNGSSRRSGNECGRFPRALKRAIAVVHSSALKSTLTKRWPGDDEDGSDHEDPQPKDDTPMNDPASFGTPAQGGGKKGVKDSVILCHD